jgi:hypothetical protein
MYVSGPVDTTPVLEQPARTNPIRQEAAIFMFPIPPAAKRTSKSDAPTEKVNATGLSGGSPLRKIRTRG